MPILIPWVLFKYLKSMWIFHFCYDFYVNWCINACYHFNWHIGIMRSYSVELKVTRHWIMNVLVFSIRDSLCVSFCLWCMCVSTCMWVLIETRGRQQSLPVSLSAFPLNLTLFPLAKLVSNRLHWSPAFSFDSAGITDVHKATTGFLQDAGIQTQDKASTL